MQDVRLTTVLGLHVIILTLLAGCGRWCTCRRPDCDVCGDRCLLSLEDGWNMRCPVRASDGRLYELHALRSYAQHASRHGNVCHVIPGQPIVTFSFCRPPLAGPCAVASRCACFALDASKRASARALAALSRICRRRPTACHDGAPYAPRRAVALRPHRRHPFPPTLARHAPRAVYALSVGWPTATKHALLGGGLPWPTPLVVQRARPPRTSSSPDRARRGRKRRRLEGL